MSLILCEPQAAEAATEVGADEKREPISEAEAALLVIIYTVSGSLVVALLAWCAGVML